MTWAPATMVTLAVSMTRIDLARNDMGVCFVDRILQQTEAVQCPHVDQFGKCPSLADHGQGGHGKMRHGELAIFCEVKISSR